MKRLSRFRITGRLDMSTPQSGTVTIDRAAGLFSVRPMRRRREYVVPLAAVAEMVVSRIIKAELADQKRGRR